MKLYKFQITFEKEFKNLKEVEDMTDKLNHLFINSNVIFSNINYQIKQKCIKHKTCKIYDKNGVTCNDEKEAQGFCGLRRKK